MTIAWLIFVTECCQFSPTSRLLCHPGTYLHTTRNNKYICLHCPDGTFMPHSLHTHKTCYNCTQIRNRSVEVLKTECSETRDTEILCIPGYYRRRHRNASENDMCEKCFECKQDEHQALPCQDYYDTVCCGSTNDDAVLNKDDVYECKEKPILCAHGQFLNLEAKKCTLCPSGTFISEVQHNKTACRPCKTVSDLGAHETILHACTSTHQTNIGCKDGYFRNSSGNLWDEVQCLPCQKCEYQGRECDMYHDRICCDYPDMIVANTSSEYECVPLPTTATSRSQTGNNTGEQNQTSCDENEYYTSFNQCVPCERGTYMDKHNHTERVCKNCSEIQGSQDSLTSCQVLISSIPVVETKYTLWISISVFLLIALIIIAVIYYFIKKYRRRRQIWGTEDTNINGNLEEVDEFMNTQSEDSDVDTFVLQGISA